jgi:hypothetical protein
MDITTNQSKHVGPDGRLRYDADGSEVFPGPTGVRAPRPTVVELAQTCGACPAQWEGRTDDGGHVYIRFRFGMLTAGFGATLDDAVSDGLYAAQLSDGLDGCLDEPTMKRRLAGVLEFA